ncbi:MULTISPECIES: hypothetical protein [unclassified Xanthomonas]|uniref:hypothetical protein n=1 Tax=unclassified Xanthomonas TaxID=2643310 RepID=UPI002B23C2B4|nr:MULTISPECIES: hypothetical protein [unclassified Xanthomonas]MEA9563218.1 hypothetical protein [Xanthomonas sp. WHRI 8932A]MEA9634637.1 hypothetical protein [Xanthomonas sp. WHRI 8812E]
MDSSDLLTTLERHLRTKNDIEMLLLKGHLILEQTLNQMLLCYFEDEKAISSLNLMFTKKLDLFEALSGRPSGFEEEIAHLREINRIRNKLAHQLDFTGMHADLKCWACGVVGYTPKSIDRKQTYRNTLLKAFYLLTGMLSGMARGRRDVMRAERSNNSFKPKPLRGAA